jgi:hypothetical protein
MKNGIILKGSKTKGVSSNNSFNNISEIPKNNDIFNVIEKKNNLRDSYEDTIKHLLCAARKINDYKIRSLIISKIGIIDNHLELTEKTLQLINLHLSRVKLMINTYLEKED